MAKGINREREEIRRKKMKKQESSGTEEGIPWIIPESYLREPQPLLSLPDTEWTGTLDALGINPPGAKPEKNQEEDQ